MEQGFWSKDWFAALAFSAAFVLLAYAVLPDRFQALERHAYDLGLRANTRVPSDRIAVIAIDDDSIGRIGGPPWPQRVHAQMLDRLREAGASAVASLTPLPGSQDAPALDALDELSAFLQQSPLTRTVPGEIEALGRSIAEVEALRARLDQAFAAMKPADPALPAPPDLAALHDLERTWAGATLSTQYVDDLAALRGRLDTVRGRLSADDVLGAAMRRQGATLLPITFTSGRPPGTPNAPLPDYVSRFALENLQGRLRTGAQPTPMTSVDLMPLPEHGEAGAGIGHLLYLPDSDGVLRVEPLAVLYDQRIYPSLSLLVAAAALGLEPQEIQVRLGRGLQLGGIRLKTSPDLQMRTHFYADANGRPPFPVYSFVDVREGRVRNDALKDKIVLIGAAGVGTGTGIGGTLATPVAAGLPPVVVLAHSVSSILQGHYFVEPAWGRVVGTLALLLVIAYLAFLLAALAPAIGVVVSAGLVAALLLTEFYLLSASALWVQLTAPALLVVLGHLFMATRKLRLGGVLKRLRQTTDAAPGKARGPTLRSQGRLDMAVQNFGRISPADDRLLDLLYELALDFERRRQFAQAERVYTFIDSKSPGFRDVQTRQARVRSLSASAIAASGTGIQGVDGRPASPGPGEMEMPMLGRYRIEKELGKGAMGVVYLGRDPKIGRSVAIKTMALSGDFSSDDIGSVKERFFREAEAAGNLSHPHIVQIFDAGEEHDLAYIAMEFIQGHDLVRYTRPDALLPVGDVLRYIADAADALDYAQSRKVVHRDIKPANLMLVADTRTIKVTDFGVARLIDASKSRTGMVLGTPSYMSPEQLSGKKVDGRSDLFSLGVTAYQLLTASLPFQAESMTTLMFKIANEPQVPVTMVRPGLPPALDGIIDKALQKHYDARYARGGDFARDLRAVLAALA